VGDGAGRTIDAPPVDQKQGVLAWHAANGNPAPRQTGAVHRHPWHVTQDIGQILNRPARQGLLIHHRDACRRCPKRPGRGRGRHHHVRQGLRRFDLDLGMGRQARPRDGDEDGCTGCGTNK